MIEIESTGSFKNTESFLKAMSKRNLYRTLEGYGRQGVDALASHTPVESGQTAGAWGFKVEHTNKNVSIIWTNSHIENGRPIAILIQYGHGTGTGGYVQGRDYINPAIRPIFDKIAESVWREVTSA